MGVARNTVLYGLNKLEYLITHVNSVSILAQLHVCVGIRALSRLVFTVILIIHYLQFKGGIGEDSV